jgi:hypothetical protein
LEAPDEKIFRAHIAAPVFQLGVETGRWRLVSVAWPNALIAVRAATRENCPGEFALRFDLTNYPAAAPTATPWDPAADSMLPAHLRPRGSRVGMAFRSDWETGRALYIPCDRIALDGHGNWPNQYRLWTWDAGKDITFYLRLVHRLLNDEDYVGV